MNQKTGFDLARGAKRQFYMCAMHRVARLEPDDPAPADTREFGAQICRHESKCAKIIMRG
jgi:hypothetical protein